MTYLHDNKQCDIVLANIPITDIRCPYLGTFLLKSVVQEHGFTCKTFDWNRDLYEKGFGLEKGIFIKKNRQFANRVEFNELWADGLEDICNDWVKEIEILNPKWFGMTFMSVKQVIIGRKILEKLREKLPKTKNVIGGFYIGTGGIDIINNFKRAKFIDYFVIGEGETAIVELLKGNYKFQGLNNTEEITIPSDLNLNPITDYSDVLHYKYKRYYSYNSRGCVNRCLYCNESIYSKKYRFRDSELVVRDIMDCKEKTGNTDFFLVDSLIDGHPKQFRKLIELLKGKGIKWMGAFACNSWMKEDDYINGAESGLTAISIGVESGSEKIRKEMGKSFSNKDLQNTIEWTGKYGISLDIMLIIGWPTETEEDFQETLDLMTELSKHDHIHEVQPGSTLLLAHGSKLTEHFNFEWDGKTWKYKDNTYPLRVNRWERLVNHCKELGLNVSENHLKRVKGIE